MSQGSLNQKIRVPRSKGVTCSPHIDRQTDTQTDTKVTIVGTLSGFQEFFLQPIIKDRLKKMSASTEEGLTVNVEV